MRIDAETALYEIIDLMSRPQGASVQEVCDSLGCQRTTFYRYRDRLEAYRIPIRQKDDYDGNTNSQRWYIDEKESPRGIPLKFDAVERMMLRTVLGRTKLFERTKLKNRMESLKAKLNAAALHDRVKTVATTHSSFKGRVSYDGKEEIIERLFSLIEERRRGTVTYRAARQKEAKTYDIEPLTLVDHANALYVIVAIPKYDGDIRILAVDRIENLLPQEFRFELPEGFDPENYLNASFGIVVEEPLRVKVRFTGDGAYYVKERTWGQEQRVVEIDEDTIELSFTASGSEEIASWILSWGSDARVLEPESLAEKVKKELAGALEGY